MSKMTPTKAVFFDDKENVSPIGKSASQMKPRTAFADTGKRLEKALENEFAVMSPVRLRGNLDRTLMGPLDQSLLDATINASMNASMFHQPGGGLNLTLLCNENSICEEEPETFGSEKRGLEDADERPAKRQRTGVKRRKPKRTLAFNTTGDASGPKRKRARKSRVVTKAKRRTSVRKASMKQPNTASTKRRRVARRKTPRRASKVKRAGRQSASVSPQPEPKTSAPVPARMPTTPAAPALSPIKAAPVSPKTERRQVKSVSKSLSKSFRQERKEEITTEEFFLKLKDGPEPDLTQERFKELLNKLHDLGRIFLQDNTIYRV